MSEVNEAKKDMILCQGCFCTNTYLRKPEGCCSGASWCLCFAKDFTFLSALDDGQVKLCTILPCCVVYPKFACCKNLTNGEFEGVDDMKDARKKEALICSGCCIPGLCAQTQYVAMPWTCCYDAGSSCLCIHSDMAFPCNDAIPKTCTLLPCCAVIPSFGCFKKLGDFDEYKK